MAKEFKSFFWERGVKVNPTYQTGKTFWLTHTNMYDKDNYSHPTIKPIEVVEKLVVNSSKENDIVFDSFLGSGTTALASKHLNRRYIGFEISPQYYKIAQERLQGINQKGEMSLFDTDFDNLEQMNLFEEK